MEHHCPKSEVNVIVNDVIGEGPARLIEINKTTFYSFATLPKKMKGFNYPYLLFAISVPTASLRVLIPTDFFLSHKIFHVPHMFH